MTTENHTPETPAAGPKPTSERRLQANRANAKKSTGPKTAAGKAKVAQNALKHGLRSSLFIVEHEDLEQFEQLRHGYIQRFQPRDQVEVDLVHQLVHCVWNQQRSWSLEHRTFDLQVFRMRVALDREYAGLDPDSRLALAVFVNSNSEWRN